MVTETEAVSAALKVAARRWPEDKDRPGRLILHLVEAGQEALAADDASRVALRRRAIRDASGIIDVPGLSDDLVNLQDEWPA